MRVEPTMPAAPTVEEGMKQILSRVADVADEVRQYAPNVHPDRVSHTSRLMCEAIHKVFEDTASGIDQRVVELRGRVDEIERGAVAFKKAMRESAEILISQVQEVMLHYEDITDKLQQSPFAMAKTPKAPAAEEPTPVERIKQSRAASKTPPAAEEPTRTEESQS